MGYTPPLGIGYAPSIPVYRGDIYARHISFILLTFVKFLLYYKQKLGKQEAGKDGKAGRERMGRFPEAL